MLAVLFPLFLILNPTGCVENVTPEREKCIRCICNAVSGCWDLVQCAQETINPEYWVEAGSPTVDGRNEDTAVAFSRCVQSEDCVLLTVDKYTKKITGEINDVNCDGIVDCRDHLAVHKYARDANVGTSVFTRAESRRFDLCTGKDVKNLTDEWNPHTCLFAKSTKLN